MHASMPSCISAVSISEDGGTKTMIDLSQNGPASQTTPGKYPDSINFDFWALVKRPALEPLRLLRYISRMLLGDYYLLISSTND
jgi:hypothetical protein